jgi:hypothetical protein
LNEIDPQDHDFVQVLDHMDQVPKGLATDLDVEVVMCKAWLLARDMIQGS